MKILKKLTGKTLLIALFTIGMTALVTAPVQAQGKANEHKELRNVKKQNLHNFVFTSSTGRYTAYAAQKYKDGTGSISYYQLPLHDPLVELVDKGLTSYYEESYPAGTGGILIEISTDGTVKKTVRRY